MCPAACPGQYFLDEDRRHRGTEAMIVGTGEIAVPAPAS